MAYFGPVPVPAVLEPVLPYAKTVASVIVLGATVATILLAHPPAFVYLILAAANTLGVFAVPNVQVDAVLQDGAAALRAGEAAVGDARRGNLSAVSGDVTTALRAIKDGAAGAEEIAREL